MAYKSGVAIIVTYQAANAETGLTIKMDIYDETHAKDDPKCIAAMTEIGTTGRYYATYTPDAAGEWIALMYKDGGGGEVVKAFRVAIADEFGVKTVVDAIQAKTDNLPGTPAADGEYDTVIAALQTDLDNPDQYKADVASLALEATLATVDGIVDDILVGTAAIDTATNATGGIRGADSDSLKTLSDQIDAVTCPAMVG